jgi:hypothetical protein
MLEPLVEIISFQSFLHCCQWQCAISVDVIIVCSFRFSKCPLSSNEMTNILSPIIWSDLIHSILKILLFICYSYVTTVYNIH